MCFTCLNVMCRVKRKKCLQSKYAYSGHPVQQVLPGSMLPVYTIKGIRFLSPRFSDGDKSTVVISNSLISNNRLSRSENLVPVLTQRSTTRQQNIVEKIRSNFPSFPQYFQYISNLGSCQIKNSIKGGYSINFRQFRKSAMSKYGYLEVFHGVPWISR